jgi:hypothetical protein
VLIRPLDLVAGAVLASAVVFAATRLSASFPSAQAPSRPASPPTVVDPLRVASSEVSRVAGAAAARSIRFVPQEGEEVLGVTSAALLEDDDGRPQVARAVDVSLLQRDDGTLSLEPWLRKAPRVGSRWLRFGLRVRAGERVECRAGWARLPCADLLAGGVAVRSTARSRVSAHVRDREGRSIPGALVFLTVSPLAVGAASVSMVSDDDGDVTFSGLEDGCEWAAELPEGVGPWKSPVRASFASGTRDVRLVVPTSDTWRHVPVRLRLAAPGQAVMIEERRPPSSALAPVWPASRLLPGGLGRDVPLHLLALGDAPLPASVELAFRGVGVVALPLTPGAEPVAIRPVR